MVVYKYEPGQSVIWQQPLTEGNKKEVRVIFMRDGEYIGERKTCHIKHPRQKEPIHVWLDDITPDILGGFD